MSRSRIQAGWASLCAIGFLVGVALMGSGAAPAKSADTSAPLYTSSFAPGDMVGVGVFCLDQKAAIELSEIWEEHGQSATAPRWQQAVVAGECGRLPYPVEIKLVKPIAKYRVKRTGDDTVYRVTLWEGEVVGKSVWFLLSDDDGPHKSRGA